MELLQSAITIVLFFVILGGLVLVHEIGHFVTARLANVRVLEFGIGFPPRAKVLARGGETLYTLNWLPIGGFVKLEGEDGDAADDPRSFSRQPLLVRLGILVAGVVMNLLVSIAIFTGITYTNDTAFGVRFGEVVPDSPAEAAGLQPGDMLVSIDGQRYSAFEGRIPVEDLAAKAGQRVTLGIERADGTFEEIEVTLRVPTEGQGALGITRLTGEPAGRIEHSITEAVGIGLARTVDAFGLILGGLADLGRSIVSDPTTPPPAAGPVGIAFQIGDVLWSLGPLYVLYLAGILSANLALVNILPFPPLDGGRMLVITLKSLFGERISLRAERLTYFVGFVALFAFLIWITVFDIARLGGVVE
ncbi:MAG TPA: M50 family metallopeptidase [Candidatus Limnocylindrales bacterium]|nr:M50 family metallopeptidase [Candidatus Limnocylindrales bacterium]